MRQLSELQDFIRLCNQANEMGDLGNLVDAMTRELGFDHVAMAHHVDLASPPEDAVGFTTYPDSWLDQFLSRRLFENDPIHLASTRVAIGFRWSDVPRLIALTPAHRDILEAARREGLADGFTVPVHVPEEYRGTISFSASDLDALPQDTLTAAQLVGAFSFEAARRIVRQRKRQLPTADVPKLTSRQLDCIVLAGQGKTDWEIAAILGLSRESVVKYLNAARRRYDVVSRTQLVVRALFDGHITFSAVIGRGTIPQPWDIARRH